ncbi:hypothetical protein JTB14_011198 [Gonioctena quinquepunctata]|nr:hypothetical protein JTB14_011198 [Gonioctena quinquepunctata]
MLQTEIRGSNCIDYFESICTADIQGLKNNSGSLTVFTDENGGILDDLIVTKISDDLLYVVSNAGRKDHDQKHMLQALEQYKKKNQATDVKIKFYSPIERSLLALRGTQGTREIRKILWEHGSLNCFLC